MRFVVGIDSGGTHIVAQVISLDGEVLSTYQAGQGNLLVNFEETKNNLVKLLEEVGHDYALTSCEGIVIGIAGAETAGGAPALLKHLNKRYAGPIELMSDATLGLWNTLEGANGILAIAGTGSAVFAKQEKQILRVGGWGYLIGDEGSAYDIARRTLQAITHFQDTQAAPAFVQLFLDQTPAQSVNELVSRVYTMSRKEIAEFAMSTAALVEQDDTAKRIIEQAATALADQVGLMISRVNRDEPLKVAESGTVLLHNKTYRQAFEKAITNQQPEVKFLTTTRNNACGAFYWFKAKEGN